MIPSTGTTAILLGESLSSMIASSNLGPAVRLGVDAPLRSSRTKCRGLNTRLINNKQPRSKAVTFHPRPLRAGAGGKRGGCGNKGGGEGGLGGFVGGISLSIAQNVSAGCRDGQAGFRSLKMNSNGSNY